MVSQSITLMIQLLTLTNTFPSTHTYVHVLSCVSPYWLLLPCYWPECPNPPPSLPDTPLLPPSSAVAFSFLSFAGSCSLENIMCLDKQSSGKWILPVWCCTEPININFMYQSLTQMCALGQLCWCILACPCNYKVRLGLGIVITGSSFFLILNIFKVRHISSRNNSDTGSIENIMES